MLLVGTTATPLSDAAIAGRMNCREVEEALTTKVIKAKVNEIVKILLDVNLFCSTKCTFLISISTNCIQIKIITIVNKIKSRIIELNFILKMK